MRPSHELRSLLVSIAGLVCLSTGACLATDAEGESSGALHLRSAEPLSASRPVWLDRRSVGSLPVTVDSVEVGFHILEVGASAAESLWLQPYRVAVTVRAGAIDTVTVPSLTAISIVTTPVAAHIRIDGLDLGSTPTALLLPRDGPTLLEFLTPHGASERVLVEPQRLAGGRLEVFLPIDVPGESTQAPARLSAARARWRVAAPLAALAAGTAGILANRAGNRAFEEYEATSDRDLMRSRFDRARRYDRAASGCWITAELLVAASAWLWLRDDGEGAR